MPSSGFNRGRRHSLPSPRPLLLLLPLATTALGLHSSKCSLTPPPSWGHPLPGQITTAQAHSPAQGSCAPAHFSWTPPCSSCWAAAALLDKHTDAFGGSYTHPGAATPPSPPSPLSVLGLLLPPRSASLTFTSYVPCCRLSLHSLHQPLVSRVRLSSPGWL